MIMSRQVHSLAGPVSSPVRTAEEHLLYFGNNTAKVFMLATLWSADALPYGSFTGQKEAASFVLMEAAVRTLQTHHTADLLLYS